MPEKRRRRGHENGAKKLATPLQRACCNVARCNFCNAEHEIGRKALRRNDSRCNALLQQNGAFFALRCTLHPYRVQHATPQPEKAYESLTMTPEEIDRMTPLQVRVSNEIGGAAFLVMMNSCRIATLDADAIEQLAQSVRVLSMALEACRGEQQAKAREQAAAHGPDQPHQPVLH